MAVPATAGSLAGESRLGHVAGHRAEAPIQSAGVRALARVEGVRHRRGGRSPPPSRGWHAFLYRDETRSAAGGWPGTHPALGWRARHARRPPRSLPLPLPPPVPAPPPPPPD